ncbi:MAG: lipocalin family protein [Paludibacter sp.]|nr:lipocalin family protein [Paludibacter sp.]MDD4198681.1 lipocalin family protein [Paludibacter sp.]MDD4427099.1 lipocalin family protein [Paludibacter sp.]
MKSAILNFVLLTFFLAVFTSCSPHIVGVWKVENFETVSQGGESISAKNIGTITFQKDGTGVKDLSFTILGVMKEDKTPFKWSLKDNLLTINGQESDFVKAWIVVENKKKYQMIKSTDGADQVQIIELRK